MRELQNDYPLAPDKIEIKGERFSEYQLEIGDLYNIPSGNVKKLVPNFFDKEKYVFRYENLIETGIKSKKKKNTSFSRIQSIAMVNTMYLTTKQE